MSSDGVLKGRLTPSEQWQAFKKVAGGDGVAKVATALPGRAGPTVSRLVRTIEEFERRSEDSLTARDAQAIADRVRNNASQAYVEDLFPRWKAFKAKQPTALNDGGDPRPLLSVHWAEMRDIASALRDSLDVPLPQLLGFPWLTSSAHNRHLVLDGEPPVIFRPDDDQKPLMSALKQHLPTDPAWGLLGRWACESGALRGELNGLDRQLWDSPALAPWPLVAASQADGGIPGRTPWFTRSMVLSGAERAIGIDQGGDSYESVQVANGNWRLRKLWQINAHVALGATSTEESLSELERLHRDLGDKLDYGQVREHSQALVNTQSALRERLDIIRHRARFHGRCELCQ